MDHNEFQNENTQSQNKKTNINLILKDQNNDDSIDLGQVFLNMKAKRRIYAWILILCLVLGLCIPLLVYQFTKEPLTVFSAVTLNYEVDNDEEVIEQDPDAPKRIMVQDLTAPDGSELDLSQITSSYVLQNALNGLELSQSITLSNLRSNISIVRTMTEESTRQQEVITAMLENKSSDAYQKMANAEYNYTNTFIVSLTNGFGDEDSRVKLELKENELRILLDRILISYNDYLVKTYADLRLPDDAISVIDIEDQDIPDTVDQLRSAMKSLYTYCDEKPEEVKEYRSWETGYTLNDLMDKLEMIQEVDVEYLYAYVYSNGIARDKGSAIDSQRYKLLIAETELDEICQNIQTGKALLDNYKNDEILVSVPENENLQTAQTNTEYYNKLLFQQADNEERAAAKREQIAELKDRIAILNAANNNTTDEQIEGAEAEIARVVAVCQDINQQIRNHMEEIFTSAFYTSLADHSEALGKQLNFIEASIKQIIIGIIAGGIIGGLIWLFAGLAPELLKGQRLKEDIEVEAEGKKQEVVKQ